MHEDLEATKAAPKSSEEATSRGRQRERRLKDNRDNAGSPKDYKSSLIDKISHYSKYQKASSQQRSSIREEVQDQSGKDLDK